MNMPVVSSKRITTTLRSPIRIAATFDERPVIDVVAQAFSSDPVVRWVWPDSQSYATHFPGFVQVFGGRAFAQKSAYFVDGYVGAALWLPPGTSPDEEALGSLVQRTVAEQRQADLFGVLEEMDCYHPSEPHWYLPLIGVDPSQQGRGYGTALMQHALIQCDRNQTLAYLEATSIKSISFYQRHGFELLGTIQVGTSPSLFPMLRRAQ